MANSPYSKIQILSRALGLLPTFEERFLLQNPNSGTSECVFLWNQGQANKVIRFMCSRVQLESKVLIQYD